MRARTGNDCPPAVGAAEGRCIAVGANAFTAYRDGRSAGKSAGGAREGNGLSVPNRTAFRSLAVRVWRYSGNQARTVVDGGEV